MTAFSEAPSGATAKPCLTVPTDLVDEILETINNVSEYVGASLNLSIESLSLNGKRLPWGDDGETDGSDIIDGAIAAQALCTITDKLYAIAEAERSKPALKAWIRTVADLTTPFEVQGLPRTFEEIDADIRTVDFEIKRAEAATPPKRTKLQRLKPRMAALRLEREAVEAAIRTGFIADPEKAAEAKIAARDGTRAGLKPFVIDVEGTDVVVFAEPAMIEKLRAARNVRFSK